MACGVLFISQYIWIFGGAPKTTHNCPPTKPKSKFVFFGPGYYLTTLYMQEGSFWIDGGYELMVGVD